MIDKRRNYLEVVRSKDEPSTECESAVDEQGTEKETKDWGESFLKRDDQHVVRAKEAEVAEDTEPDKQVARPQ